MDKTAEQITTLVLLQFKQRVLEESIPRIEKCLNQISEEELWRKPNPSSNSVANLILHLVGNAKQYILSGIGGATDQRKRSEEFNTRIGFNKKQFAELLSELSSEMEAVIKKLDASDLILMKDVQCYHMSVTAILIHVIEHFSYHTGQIVYFTKALKDVDLAFYGKLDLEKKANGKPLPEV